MSPINWDHRLDAVLDALAKASDYNFINDEEKDLFVNSMASVVSRPFKYNVVYSNGVPVVINGRVERRYDVRN